MVSVTGPLDRDKLRRLWNKFDIKLKAFLCGSLVSGDVPYPGAQTKDLLESLKSGHRMDKPVKTSTVVYVRFYNSILTFDFLTKKYIP